MFLREIKGSRNEEILASKLHVRARAYRKNGWVCYMYHVKVQYGKTYKIEILRDGSDDLNVKGIFFCKKNTSMNIVKRKPRWMQKNGIKQQALMRLVSPGFLRRIIAHYKLEFTIPTDEILESKKGDIRNMTIHLVKESDEGNVTGTE